MGSFQGALSGMKATEPGAVTIRAAVERSGMESSMIDRTHMGCVLPAGFGQSAPPSGAWGWTVQVGGGGESQQDGEAD